MQAIWLKKKGQSSLVPDIGSDSDASPPCMEKLPEVAARVFFQLITWTRYQLPFACLPLERQIATFQQCWPALFVLTCGERPFITSQQILAESTDFLKEKAEVRLSVFTDFNARVTFNGTAKENSKK
ncbi:hypothetical protein OESDEN_21393 [Oesophagostomum dentatum]|uniref:NR LBD domain-containing protein n=1 Tax=Oesophagostomum dentatum TaxID=61180 RepID=A0A0B1S652_OESDE|nr:hypothetical protein OESDEN_21393 [Oesophagostomum dentatum]